MAVKKATKWLRYDYQDRLFVPHHKVYGHVDKGAVIPYNSNERMMALWSSMRWKKVYGYIDTETKKFIPSKRKNHV